MKHSSLEIYVAQLLRTEGGVVPESNHYMALRDAFERGRARGFRAEVQTVNGVEPTLYGLSLTQVRRMWRDYYGLRGVEKMGAECLQRLTYDDWLLALQRTCWLPLCCEKMPFQQLSNEVAERVRLSDDPTAVLHQLMHILEHLRQCFARPFPPLPPSDVITHHITRRLYCQIGSKPVCEEVVRLLEEQSNTLEQPPS